MSNISLLEKIIFNRKQIPSFDELEENYRNIYNLQNQAINNAQQKYLDNYYKLLPNPVFSSSDLILAIPDIYYDNILLYEFKTEKNWNEFNNLFIKFYETENIKNIHSDKKTLANKGSYWISLELINNHTIGEKIKFEIEKIVNNYDKNINQNQLEFLRYELSNENTIHIFIKEKLYNEIIFLFNSEFNYANQEIIRRDELYSYFQLLNEKKFFNYLKNVDLLESYKLEKHREPKLTDKKWRYDIGDILINKNEEFCKILELIEAKYSWKTSQSIDKISEDIGGTFDLKLDEMLEENFENSEFVKTILNKVKIVFLVIDDDNSKYNNIISRIFILCNRSNKEIDLIKEYWNEVKDIIYNYKLKKINKIDFPGKKVDKLFHVRPHAPSSKTTYKAKGIGDYDIVIHQWVFNKNQFREGNSYIIKLLD